MAIIDPDPNPPAPGIPQPVFVSGSATVPAVPVNITGTPIIPPPPIGNPVGVPPIPPPIPIPSGPLVGPAIDDAPVPPSLAGVVQPVFTTGSATAPTAASLFPDFTTVSPNPPIVFANLMMIGGMVPPSTPTTPQVTTVLPFKAEAATAEAPARKPRRRK